MIDSKRDAGTEKESAPVPEESRFTDPVCGMAVGDKERGYTRTYEGRSYRFCSLGCVEKFEANPDRFGKHNR